MKNLFITGADGYVGSYLVPTLIAKSYHLKLLIYSGNSDLVDHSNQINVIKGDLRNKDLIKSCLNGCDAVIHLGAIVGSYNVADNMAINFEGTNNIINACKYNGIRRLIFISSVSAARHAQGPYGQSKKLAEEAVINSELDYTILRPTTIMGRESLGLNRIIKNVNRFKYFIPMVGLGYNTRHPVYILDFVGLIKKLLEEEITYKKVYEVGGERIIYFRDLVQLVNKKIGNREKIILPVPKQIVSIAAFFFERLFSIPPFTGEHVNALGEDTIMDTKLMQDDLDFEPTSLEAMLDVIISEIKENPPNLLN